MISKPTIYIHADDYGLTKGITRSLDKLIDKSNINSVSVMVNGYENCEFSPRCFLSFFWLHCP